MSLVLRLGVLGLLVSLSWRDFSPIGMTSKGNSSTISMTSGSQLPAFAPPFTFSYGQLYHCLHHGIEQPLEMWVFMNMEFVKKSKSF